MSEPVTFSDQLNSFRDVLENERWRLNNSFGNGPFKDGLVQTRIDEIDARLARMGFTPEPDAPPAEPAQASGLLT